MAPAGPHRAAAQLLRVGLAALPVALGAPMDSCTLQDGCINFDVSESCTAGDPCKYRVCMWWDGLKPGCVKAATDTISHICYHQDGCTTQNLVPSTDTSTEVLQPVTTVRASNTKYCDYVLPGGVATFMVKDGSKCDNALAGKQISGTLGTATCDPNLEPPAGAPGKYWCQGNADYQGCLWKITVPATTPSCAGTGTCTCPNGVVDTANCPAAGGVKCWSCSRCYHLENSACVADSGHNSNVCNPNVARNSQLAVVAPGFGVSAKWGGAIPAVALPAWTMPTAGVVVGMVGLIGAAFVGFWRVQRSASTRHAFLVGMDEAIGGAPSD